MCRWRSEIYQIRPIAAIDGCFLNVVPIGIVDFLRENAFICSNHDEYYNHVIYLRQEPCTEEREETDLLLQGRELSRGRKGQAAGARIYRYKPQPPEHGDRCRHRLKGRIHALLRPFAYTGCEAAEGCRHPRCCQARKHQPHLQPPPQAVHSTHRMMAQRA